MTLPSRQPLRCLQGVFMQRRSFFTLSAADGGQRVAIIDAADEITLSGSDLETSSKANFTAQIIEAGKVLVPGKLLVEITRSLPNKPITITLDGTRVLVTSGSAKFTLPTL